MRRAATVSRSSRWMNAAILALVSAIGIVAFLSPFAQARTGTDIQHGTAVACLKTFVHRSYGITRLANGAQMNEEISYRLFKLIEENPDISQRELAKAMGISLGKTNYCLKALMDKGWLKACNFKNSNNKIAYAYALTPSGLGEKAKITARGPRASARSPKEPLASRTIPMSVLLTAT